MPESLSPLVSLGFVPISHGAVACHTLQVDSRNIQTSTTWPAMGTFVSLDALGASRARVDDGVGRAFEEMLRLISILSRFEYGSPLAGLNSEGRLDGPPPELVDVVAQGLAYHRLSRGAFDISVLPVVTLLRRRLGGYAPAEPTAAELHEAASLVGAKGIRATRRQIRFDRTGMGITLDGIAKGFIVDVMARTLERGGVTRYLINAGGDIRTAGTNQRGEPWRIAVQDPWDDARPADTLRLSGGAVATAGSYLSFFDADRRFHHIVDGRTGRSPGHCVSATVIAPTAMAADALATSVFVMAPREGLKLVESLGGCACLLLGADGRRFASRGWGRYARRPVTYEE